MDDIKQLRATTTGFAKLELGLDLYGWQAKSLLPLEWATGPGIGPGANRQNIAIVTPNGSGKDERIIPVAAYWWLFYHPRGRVIITTKSDNQLDNQTLPNLKRHYRKFGWSDPVDSPRFTLTTPTGGSLIAFVTNKGVRVEGNHSRPGEPLLMIVNEAKSIDPDIWVGIDRCTPDVLMLLSSPGGREGRFYDCFSKLAHLYHRTMVGLKDCPHITQAKIDATIATYGPNDPVTLSILYGQFMKSQEGIHWCLTPEEYESCLNFPPVHKPGFKYGFFDFAEGRAENVLVIRNGNKYDIADAWRDHNEDAVVGRAIYLLNKHGLKNGHWGADAAAKSILDKMASSGYVGARKNFGTRLKDSIYKSWGAKAWLEGCKKIRDREVIIPNDGVLISQTTKRKRIFQPDGRQAVEEKLVMFKERQLESPDRADALFGCMDAHDNTFDVQEHNVYPDDFTAAQDHEDALASVVGL